MKKTINLFVDMDGTVAKFYHDKKCLEKMYEQGYFLNLPTYAIAKAINDFADKETCVEIFILSACVKSPYCEEEKTAWLLKNMPNINPKNFIFTKVGESKLQKAYEKLGDIFNERVNVLLDDYTANLETWISGNENMVAIKFINGFNNKSNKWQGKSTNNFNGLLKILNQIAMYGR